MIMLGNGLPYLLGFCPAEYHGFSRAIIVVAHDRGLLRGRDSVCDGASIAIGRECFQDVAAVGRPLVSTEAR